MKKAIFKTMIFSFLFVCVVASASAQDDDGIYGDIRKTPVIEETVTDTVSPLDGYSTVDDYYPEGRGTSGQSNGQAQSEQYVDESGNNITNNYYGDYYEDDNDFFYASRINRFHRPIYNYGYYDPYYTNMYYYNYDPFYWGTSIYIGYRPSNYYGWNNWGWGNYYGGWGWNSPFYYSPACYGGYGYGYGSTAFGANVGYGCYGYAGGFCNGYNNGYWNGFQDGLSYGGYYNTFDQNSGIYYGPRGGAGSTGTIGSGYRNTTFASIYNEAAKSGKVNHANIGNVLQTSDARSVKVEPNRAVGQSISAAPNASRGTVNTSKDVNPTQRIVTENNRVRTDVGAGRTGTRENPYQGAEVRQNPASNSGRTIQPNMDRTRIYDASKPQDQRAATQRPNTYQRGAEPSRTYSGQQPTRSGSENRGNIYRDPQRTQPNNDYYRGNSGQNGYQQPSRSGNDSGGGNQYSVPSNDQRQNNYTPPNRTQPTSPNRTEPSRGSQPARTEPPRVTQPPRNVSPATAPNRGSSNNGGFSNPGRSSGSAPGSGSRGGSSGSRSGRP